MSEGEPGDPFVLPVDGILDLHAFAPAEVRDVVADYLEAACAAGLPEIRIIHGRGRGVQRGMIHALLAAHPLVKEFWDAPESHLGATVARLAKR